MIDFAKSIAQRCDEIEAVHGQTFLETPDSPQPQHDCSLAPGSYLPRRPNGYKIFARTGVDLVAGKALP